MTGGLLGLRTGSNGSLQQNSQINSVLQAQNSVTARKPPKMFLSASREKERLRPRIFRYLGKRNVGMLVLVVFALLAFMTGFFTVHKDAKESTGSSITLGTFPRKDGEQRNNSYILLNTVKVCGENIGRPHTPNYSAAKAVTGSTFLLGHQCLNFAFPSPPAGGRKGIGPRPCPVCYLPVEHAIASMPRSQSMSPVLHHLTYFHEENPIKAEPHGGSDFGGFPSLGQRNDSFDIKESMTVHCGFVKGCRPGYHTGFNIDDGDLEELEQYHDVVVASAIFGIPKHKTS